MTSMTEQERRELIVLLETGAPLSDSWRARLFPGGGETVGKEYRLVYEGKAKREAILAETPAAPWQLVRRFCEDRPFDDGWRNLLVFGNGNPV